MKKIKLGDLCVPSAGQLKKDSDEIIDYIDISSVDNETKKVTSYQTLLFEEAPSRARKIVKKGSILVSTVRPNLNAVAMLEEDTPNISVASTGFCVLDSKENVDNRFILNFCKSKTFINAMVAQATGASYPAVSDKIVRAALVPDYTYEEQCNISEVLYKVSNVIEKRKAELCSLDTLIKARFVELFGDPIRNTQNRPTTEFINVVKMQRGFDLPVQDRQQDGEIPVFGSNGALDYHNVAKIHGGVITGRSGTIGKVFYTEGDFWPLNTSLFSADTHGNNVIYLGYLLQLFDLTRFVEGTGVPTLNRNMFHNKQIIDVPIDEQRQFAEFVKQIDKSKSAVKKALDETQLLFDSLMQEYFG